MRRYLYVTVLILLLAACGTASESEQVESVNSVNNNVEEVAETAATALPTDEPPATDVPPTDTPIPTPTLAPTQEPPTDVPTEVPTEESTALPLTDVPTETPTEIPPTAVPTDVPPTSVPTDIPPTAVPPTAAPTDTPPTAVPPTAPPPSPTPEPPTTALPLWQTAPLVDAKTGATFRLSDYVGETVFIEPMATWCTNCRNQLGQVSTAMNTVGWGNARVIALSVETNLTQAQMAEYAESTQLPFQFAVMTPAVLESLVAQFGRSLAVPPSTPHFIIKADGTTTALQTGFESADEIAAEILSTQ